MSVSVQGRLPARRHGGMRCSRSLSVLAREMPPRLTRPARRNCSVRFDQLEVAEAARSTRHCPRAQALVDNRPGGGDSFATPVALVHVALDRHQVSPSAASSRKLPVRCVCPVPEPAKRGAPCPPRNSARPRRYHTSCHPGRHSRFTSRPHITTDDALMQTAPEPAICAPPLRLRSANRAESRTPTIGGAKTMDATA